MTNTEIYVLLGVVFFLTGFGGIVIYRECLPKFSSNRSVLRRDYHDIELQDVIQPARDLDLSSLPEYPTTQGMINHMPEIPFQQAVINHMPIRWDLYPVPRYSQISGNTVPGYSVNGNSVPRYSDYYIQSALENNINLKFIFLILIVIVILAIIWKLRIKYLKNKNKIFILGILIFIMNSLVLYNSLKLEMALLIPFSLFEIDFRDSFEWKHKRYGIKHKISYLKIQTLTCDIDNLLYSLEDEVNYSLSLSFISSYEKWKDNKKENPPLLISDAIIVNKESDPLLISQFIMEQLDDKGIFISNWLVKDYSINSMDPRILTATVAIEVKIE
uniref:hypothetical protein n=1 Tax=Russula rosea TaxID=176822 RepID=UPI002028FFFF|nr:hypothetical protein NDC34_mgp01 [Russula rosea]UHA57018.1 hypothetical protein [Russula rosea]